ncbi:unnamed protein product, partial [Sphacelaria rigidula]
SRQVPLVKLRKNRGSMLAANELVCNSFFALAFRVSHNTIESAKRNPRSSVVLNRADSSQVRSRHEHVVAFLDHFAASFGQHMP